MGINILPTPALIGAVPIARELIAGANVTIDGGASGDLSADLTIAATGGGGGGGLSLVHRALVYKLANQTVPGSAVTKITFAGTIYDPDTIWDGTNNRFVVPSGVSLVRIISNFSRSTQTGQLQIIQSKNGDTSGLIKAGLGIAETDTGGEDSIGCVSAFLEVVATDYFEMYCFNSGSSDVQANSWFSCEMYN